MNTNCLEGIACPKCKQEDAFHIEATIMVFVTDDGTDDTSGQYEWDKRSYIRCAECDHAGSINEFTIDPLLAEYDEYFEAMERANKVPLTHGEWRKTKA